MVEIPIKAKVECTDGPCGQSIAIIVDPVNHKVTDVVVEIKGQPDDKQRLVPVDRVQETSHSLIRLNCDKAALEEMEPFLVTRYVPKEARKYPSAFYSGEGTSYLPASDVLAAETVPVEEEQIPLGEMAFHEGANVEASDGWVGRVDEFLVDPDSQEITYLVLREGHLWGKKEISLPISAIDRVEEDVVYLKLDKEAISSLPAVPLERSYRDDRPVRVELVAKIFSEPAKADEALEFLKDLQKRKTLKIRGSAVLVKDDAGKISMREEGDVDAKHGRVFGAITGGLIGLVGGPVGAVVGALAGAGTGGLAANKIDMGLSDEFLKKFQEQLQPGNAALIVLLEHTWVKPVSESLAQIEGTIIQQSLTDDMVEQFLNQVE